MTCTQPSKRLILQWEWTLEKPDLIPMIFITKYKKKKKNTRTHYKEVGIYDTDPMTQHASWGWKSWCNNTINKLTGRNTKRKRRVMKQHICKSHMLQYILDFGSLLCPSADDTSPTHQSICRWCCTSDSQTSFQHDLYKKHNPWDGYKLHECSSHIHIYGDYIYHFHLKLEWSWLECKHVLKCYLVS